MSDGMKNTISSAGSASAATSISRLAPSEPNAVPASIAASAMKTRARASNPTSAMTSAAGENGRPVASIGTMPLASTMQPNTRYGTARNRNDAWWASTTSLRKSFAITRYGCVTPGPRRFCNHARHWLIQPSASGATSTAKRASSSCENAYWGSITGA